jgi:hypothetical protein
MLPGTIISVDNQFVGPQITEENLNTQSIFAINSGWSENRGPKHPRVYPPPTKIAMQWGESSAFGHELDETAI